MEPALARDTAHTSQDSLDSVVAELTTPGYVSQGITVSKPGQPSLDIAVASVVHTMHGKHSTLGLSSLHNIICQVTSARVCTAREKRMVLPAKLM
jgi:hypothetical protein